MKVHHMSAGSKKKNSFPSNPIIITGMHRSGTSLVTSYFELCGLDIGKNALPKKPENPKGFFEDADFVNLHQKILRENKIWLYTPQTTQIPRKNIKQIKALVRKKENNSHGLWGWKDPRTVIFLALYNQILPGAHFVFLYRHPFYVVDSLIRRFSDWHVRLWPFVGARSWLWYNRKILKFKNDNPEKCGFFNLKDFIGQPKNAINFTNKKWDLNLEQKDFSKVYDPTLLKKKKNFNPLSRLVIFFYRNKLLSLYNEMENRKDLLD